ncbi:MAG: adenylate kinase family protein [Methanomicrobiales archaeon]|nr:adenylate kinase family protein [Methanomicrobiales archaeon]
MMCGITGTPGTGKSSVACILAARGHRVVHLAETYGAYITGRDEERDTLIVDEERWAAEFPHVDGFVEGHLAHLLPCDLVIVLRCGPDVLRSRLERRGYRDEKIEENVEAEALDLILIEALEERGEEAIHEVDTTSITPEEAADIIEMVTSGKMKRSFGSRDWSRFLSGERS